MQMTRYYKSLGQNSGERGLYFSQIIHNYEQGIQKEANPCQAPPAYLGTKRSSDVS